MPRPTNEARFAKIHQEAMREFDNIQSALRDERLQCLQDRRFLNISGAQWEGPLGAQFENKPRLEVNKIALAVQRIFNEYRNNRVTVEFVSKEGAEYDELADTCNALYRADEQDSGAEEAYDNGFEEATSGGIGAWRLRTVYENEEDDEDERQRIRIEPIYDADSSVWFDLQAKRQDKADATRCFVLTSMTREAYKDTWGDDPATWPKEVHQYEFDWLTPDVVFVAEYFRVEMVNDTIHIFRSLDGEEERYREDELTDDMMAELSAIGSVEVRQKKVKRTRVRKYILSGSKVLEDAGYIAGKHIPIVPVYGKRSFIDNVERCYGHVRLAKDAQRLKNMQLSKLAEISALSSVEKPIMTPEQIVGHQVMWEQDNLKNYPYLLVNPVTGPDGMTQVSGPVGYTKSPEIPPAMAALLQLTEQDMKDVLGNQEQGDKIVANVSGKALQTVQERLDMQSFIYISNYAKAKRRCGEIWLGMAKEIYVEPKRKMKGLGAQGEVSGIELMKPKVNDEGELEYENDLSEADFDLAVEIGPSFRSQRASIVQSLTNLIAITQDPQTQAVLQAMVIMNMEGEGLSDTREYFRKKLVEMGVLEPNEEDQARMQAMQESAQNDPNAKLMLAATEEAMAKAEKARAEVVKTLAESELAQAKTAETLNKAGIEGGEQQASPPPMSEREALEVEAMRLENEMRRRKVESTDTQIEQLRAERQANDSMVQASQAMQEAVSGLGQSVAVIGDAVGRMSEAVGQFAATSSANTDKAIAAISRPKRVVREKGRISRIETEG